MMNILTGFHPWLQHSRGPVHLPNMAYHKAIDKAYQFVQILTLFKLHAKVVGMPNIDISINIDIDISINTNIGIRNA